MISLLFRPTLFNIFILIFKTTIRKSGQDPWILDGDPLISKDDTYESERPRTLRISPLPQPLLQETSLTCRLYRPSVCLPRQLATVQLRKMPVAQFQLSAQQPQLWKVLPLMPRQLLLQQHSPLLSPFLRHPFCPRLFCSAPLPPSSVPRRRRLLGWLPDSPTVRSTGNEIFNLLARVMSPSRRRQFKKHSGSEYKII